MARRSPSRRYLNAPEGAGFTRDGKLYRKEVLRTGYYKHPTAGWEMDLELADLVLLCDESNRAIENGNRCWIPIGHTDDVRANRGYAKRFEIEARTDLGPDVFSIYAICSIRDPETAEAIDKGLIEDVSVGIEEVDDGRGNEYGPRIVHVALVNFPVFAGQENFIALAAGAGKKSTVALRYLGARPMKRNARSRLLSGAAVTPIVKKVRRLSVSGAVRKAAKALGVELGSRVRQEDLDALATAAVEQGTKTPSGVDAARKALSRNADATFVELHNERERRIGAQVEAAVTAGRIPASVKDDVRALLSVRHGMSLSVKGEAGDVDVPALVEKLVNAIPEEACVPLEDRLKKLSVAGGKPAGKAPDFDPAKDKAARIAALSPKK